jgi:hypothetical protein
MSVWILRLKARDARHYLKLRSLLYYAVLRHTETLGKTNVGYETHVIL